MRRYQGVEAFRAVLPEHDMSILERIDSPADLNPKTPPAVSNLVLEMISTKVQKRPADMDEVITRLELGKHVLMKQTNNCQMHEVSPSARRWPRSPRG